jgi:hypothetical protein
MAIRGRRYPSRSLVHSIIMANPVPRGFVRWARPVNRVPRQQNHVPTNIVPNNAPGSPIASVIKWHRNILPARFTARTNIRTAMAGSQPNALVFSIKQHRPAINVQNAVHRVTIIRNNIPPSGNPVGNTIHNRSQVVSRPVVHRRTPVTVVNPPTPTIQSNRFDMHRLARQRTMIPMVYPNRRGQ